MTVVIAALPVARLGTQLKAKARAHGDGVSIRHLGDVRHHVAADPCNAATVSAALTPASRATALVVACAALRGDLWVAHPGDLAWHVCHGAHSLHPRS